MSSKKTRVFIAVKTYPTLSVKYDELVCTAGITEEGKWIRIYPVPFRKLTWEKQYRKYQWIELEVIKNNRDFRLESYRPKNRGETIQLKERIKNWEDRKRFISKVKIHKDLQTLIKEAKSNKKTSLAVFKPKKIIDFKCEREKNKQWDSKKIKEIKEKGQQLNLFNSDKPHEIFKIVKKLPYKFSYIFTDQSNKQSTLMIEDWEIGALYWNCLKRENSEEKAVQKVKNKYLNDFKKKDLYLFLGTTKKFHNVAPNPFVIIGVFSPPLTNQLSLL